MTKSIGPQTAISPDLEHMTRMWASGWRRYFFPGFWLVYLGQTVAGVQKHSNGAAALAGYLIVVAFAAVYLTSLPMAWTGQRRMFWILYSVGVALTALECLFAENDALVFLVYLAVLTIASQVRFALVVVVAMAVTATALPWAIRSWGAKIDYSTGLAIVLVAIAMFGFFKIVQSNIALGAARAEVARLAAENERSRIARDLHDLLGHSLTTITVKAGLARRLAEHGDAERAFAEISEVEQLSRSTLGDVRAAVSAHREVTLTGELATAREVLRASGILAEMPPTVAQTDPELSELFGWIVREGTTNVVRHSRAEHVRVELGKRHIEIFDDGKGGTPGIGNGIAGLRERAETVGGVLTATGTFNGFRLRVEVPADAAIPASDQWTGRRAAKTR